MMIKHLRVGFPVLGSSDWMGGFTYIELLVKALSRLPKDEKPRLFLVVGDHSLKAYDNFVQCIPFFDNIIYIGEHNSAAKGILHLDPIHFESYLIAYRFLDCFYPALRGLWPFHNGIASIFDFQHCYLPDFFSKEELSCRHADYATIARESKVIVFNSVSAENDFKKYFPHSESKTYALPFHIAHDTTLFLHDPVEVQRKYNVPDKFLICCNQFWAHKNHVTLFDAIARLKNKGMPVHLVCTGMTVDYRFPDFFPALQHQIEQLGIRDLVHILGFISRNDQIQLMRRAAAVIQPSLFEGWSTVVEDAQSLGKTIILSDLPVHIEQAPQYAYYFEARNAEALSRQIAALYPSLTPGPDIKREEFARRAAEDMVLDYAKKFCNIIVDAYAIFACQAEPQKKIHRYLAKPLAYLRQHFHG